ncbi:hypothetical protein HELRODRAFT_152402, partial [Helobdella robusta]|uniref:Uncharacterized protein n=1 Tax=Helobdella robusta TaxID=6412 RepID=T1EKR6_HELRO
TRTHTRAHTRTLMYAFYTAQTHKNVSTHNTRIKSSHAHLRGNTHTKLVTQKKKYTHTHQLQTVNKYCKILKNLNHKTYTIVNMGKNGMTPTSTHSNVHIHTHKH